MDERKYPHPMPGSGLGESISELAQDASRLVHLEIDLFKQEVGALVKRNAIAVGMLASAALSALMFLIFLLVLIILLIPRHRVAAAVVALLWLLATVILGLVGKSKIKIAPPNESINSLKEDLEWAKRQIKPAPK